jgi:hypothetical protein
VYIRLLNWKSDTQTDFFFLAHFLLSCLLFSVLIINIFNLCESSRHWISFCVFYLMLLDNFSHVYFSLLNLLSFSLPIF